MITMTPRQFEALAQLMRINDSVSSRAASLVLVSGYSTEEAARVTGLSLPALNKMIERVNQGMRLAKIAAR